MQELEKLVPELVQLGSGRRWGSVRARGLRVWRRVRLCSRRARVRLGLSQSRALSRGARSLGSHPLAEKIVEPSEVRIHVVHGGGKWKPSVFLTLGSTVVKHSSVKYFLARRLVLGHFVK